MVNVTEYLEQLFATGVQPADLPTIQPLYQHRIWQQLAPGDDPDRLADAIGQLTGQDSRFHMEGGSWTSDLSWTRGYDKVLVPMEQASSLFHERVLARGVPSDDPRYRKALFHLLAAETSCYRYWGEGVWTTTAPNCPVAPPTSSRSSDTRQGKDGHRQLLDQSSSSCVVGPRWWSAPS
jgi:hypothetical protein